MLSIHHRLVLHSLPYGFFYKYQSLPFEQSVKIVSFHQHLYFHYEFPVLSSLARPLLQHGKGGVCILVILRFGLFQSPASYRPGYTGTGACRTPAAHWPAAVPWKRPISSFFFFYLPILQLPLPRICFRTVSYNWNSPDGYVRNRDP